MTAAATAVGLMLVTTVRETLFRGQTVQVEQGSRT
jgi:hypothetical protein